MATPAAAQSAATTTALNQPPPTFALQEHVFCFHGPLIYEAKILRTQWMEEPSLLTGKTGMHYFVHYKGWKRTWDEWVVVSRLLKLTEQNLALQKSLQAQHSTTSHAGGGSASAAAKTGKAGVGSAKADGGSGSTRLAVRKEARGTKRSREDDDSARKPELKLNVPEILKGKLVDDWENVTKHNLLVPLPRNPTVEQILQDFSEHILKTKPPHLREPTTVLATVVSGIQCYFDKALGISLLYRFERLQYSEVRRVYYTGQDVVVGVTEKEMSCIYGAEHFLRMLVTLPQMIAQSSLDPDSVSLIRDYVNELLQYMLVERDRFFLKEYGNVGTSYQNVMRS